MVAIAAMSGVVVGFLGGFKTASTLYADDKAKQAFDAAATVGPDGTCAAPWLAIEAYVKKRDKRWLDPKYALYQNLKAFYSKFR